MGSIPGSGRSPGEGNGNPLQYSCMENPMDTGVWRASLWGRKRVRHDLAIKQQNKSDNTILSCQVHSKNHYSPQL